MPFVFSLIGLPCAPRVKGRRWIRRVGVLLGVAILSFGCDPSSDRPEAAAERLRESRSLLLEASSEGGHYRVSARPATSPLELHRIHDWIVGIEPLEGSSQIPTAILFDGGMPSHGHGFVTRPRVTRNLGNGEFLVEGVKFHMPGEWVLRVTVTGRELSDYVKLPLMIEP